MVTHLLPPQKLTSFTVHAPRRDLELKLVAIDGEPYVTVESLATLAYTTTKNITNYVTKLGHKVLRQCRKYTSAYNGGRGLEIISYAAALDFLAAGPLKPGNTKKCDTSATINLYFKILSSPVNYRKVYYKLNLPLPYQDLPKPKTTAAGYMCVNGRCFKPIERARFEG